MLSTILHQNFTESPTKYPSIYFGQSIITLPHHCIMIHDNGRCETLTFDITLKKSSDNKYVVDKFNALKKYFKNNYNVNNYKLLVSKVTYPKCKYCCIFYNDNDNLTQLIQSNQPNMFNKLATSIVNNSNIQCFGDCYLVYFDADNNNLLNQ